MKHPIRSIFTAMEDDAASDQDIASDHAELDALSSELTDQHHALSDVVDGTATLSAITSSMESRLATGGLSVPAAQIAAITTRSIYKRLGIRQPAMISLEAFSSANTRVYATQIAMESGMDVLKKIGIAIKEFFIKMWRTFMSVLYKARAMFNRLLTAKRIHLIMKRLDKLDIKSSKVVSVASHVFTDMDYFNITPIPDLNNSKKDKVVCIKKDVMECEDIRALVIRTAELVSVIKPFFDKYSTIMAEFEKMSRRTTLSDFIPEFSKYLDDSLAVTESEWPKYGIGFSRKRKKEKIYDVEVAALPFIYGRNITIMRKTSSEEILTLQHKASRTGVKIGSLDRDGLPALLLALKNLEKQLSTAYGQMDLYKHFQDKSTTIAEVLSTYHKNTMNGMVDDGMLEELKADFKTNILSLYSTPIQLTNEIILIGNNTVVMVLRYLLQCFSVYENGIDTHTADSDHSPIDELQARDKPMTAVFLMNPKFKSWMFNNSKDDKYFTKIEFDNGLRSYSRLKYDTLINAVTSGDCEYWGVFKGAYDKYDRMTTQDPVPEEYFMILADIGFWAGRAQHTVPKTTDELIEMMKKYDQSTDDFLLFPTIITGQSEDKAKYNNKYRYPANVEHIEKLVFKLHKV